MQEYNNDDKKFEINVWKQIFKVVFSKKIYAFLLFFTIMLTVFAETIYPILNALAIEKFLEHRNYTDFNKYIIYYSLLAVIIGISTTLFLLVASKMENNTSYEFRKKAYEKLQLLSYSYYDTNSTGWIMSRMTSDSRRLSFIISWGLVDILWSFISMFVIFIILLIYHFVLALISLILVPVIFLFSFLIRKKLLKSYRNARRVNSIMTANYNDSFMGSKTTKTLVIEDSNYEEFVGHAKEYKRYALRAAIYSSLFGPVVFLLTYSGVGFTLIFGGAINLGFINIKPIDVTTLYLFVSYIIRFFDPITILSKVLADVKQAQASAERVIQLINTELEIKDTKEVINKYGDIFNPKYENYEKLEGKIEFKDVSFKYKKGETVLNNFNLVINKGQTVALVGHTGSGKSTIVNLISRFYEPTSGSILIDDLDYKKRSIGWLHYNLGYVLQSPQLFKGSIKDNIKYGKLNATDEEVINAAKVANCFDFIMSLEGKFDFNVGESGNRLSIGQRQLISFARAIIRDPKIIILDEATSSVDTEAELLIQDALEKILKNRTSIIIAHRLSTVINSDKIIVLKNGAIVENGTHKELLNNKGYYYELYQNQFYKVL